MKSPSTDKHGQARAALGRWTRALLSLCMVGLPLEGGLAMGFAAGGQSPAGKEMVGPQRERMREQRELDATGAEPEREARAAALQARLVWLETLLQAGDESGATAGSIAAHHSAPPRAPLEVYRHGRVIDPSIYLHHASR